MDITSFCFSFRPVSAKLLCLALSQQFSCSCSLIKVLSPSAIPARNAASPRSSRARGVRLRSRSPVGTVWLSTGGTCKPAALRSGAPWPCAAAHPVAVSELLPLLRENMRSQPRASKAGEQETRGRVNRERRGCGLGKSF